MTMTVLAPAVGEVGFKDEWVTVDYVEGHRGDGSTFPHHRVKLGAGKAALVICLAGDKVAMVRQPRVAAGISSSLELCGGGVDEHTAEEALRELFEETGLHPSAVRTVRLLRIFHETPGMVVNTLSVWLVEADPVSLCQEVEWESGATAEWMLLADAQDSEDVTSASTLAAFQTLARHRRLTNPKPNLLHLLSKAA